MKNIKALYFGAILLVGATAWFIYSGNYNVAATEPHTEFVRWLLTTAKNQSIKEHAGTVSVPLTGAGLIEEGAQHYDSSCALCHGAPGEKLSEIAQGLNPSPPELHMGETQRKYTDSELYWIVEHGIRMTGMPAFGSTHKPYDIQGIVAFLKQLPNMQPEEYRAITRGKSPSHRHPDSERHSG